MKILAYFPFTDEQVVSLRVLVGDDHDVIHVSTDEDALRVIDEVEVILGHCPRHLFAEAKSLRWIQGYSAGMDKYPLEEIAGTDVVITNMAGVYASQCAEHAWALLLALARGLPHFVHRQDRKEWTTFSPFLMSLVVDGSPIFELEGSTLGLVGFGGFGTHMAKRALGYEMTILAVDPVRREKPDYVAELKDATRENLHSLLRRSDVVMLACPRTPETIHLIGADELAQMKPSAYLINVTRGGIIDEPALMDALRNGRLAGAGLDVFEQEPLPSDSPLWETPNLLMTTHMAGASQLRPHHMFEFFCRNLQRYLKGEPLLNVVDKQRGF